jgi:hypothetical protein
MGFYNKKGQTEKKITINTIMKNQVLKCPYQEAFYTGTLQEMWSKM